MKLAEMAQMDDSLVASLLNFHFFAEHFIKIKTKAGNKVSFKLNKAQRYIIDRLEAQQRETGKIRAVILKGRQQGCSTLIQAYFFHKTLTRAGTKTFILTHENEATRSLFDMTKRMYDSLPSGLCPKAQKDTANSLYFKELDSGYAVATAGNRGAGRSQTVQLFHGSETAYWPHAEEHARGVLQAVSNEDETAVILESTANGIGNYFYNSYKSAESGESDYQAIFVPWYWQNEYKVKVGDDFTLNEEEVRYLKMYVSNGLTVQHLAWRRKKLKEFSQDPAEARALFQCEYPFNADEAFRNPVENQYIPADAVNMARINHVDMTSKLVIGVDPAITDTDRLAIIRRRGRVAYDLKTHHGMDTMQIVGMLRNIIDKEKPYKMYIDVIGIGAGIVDRLLELGYNCVEGVAVSRKASDVNKFKNLRAELWYECKKWLTDEAMSVQIPDVDALQADLCAVGYWYTSNGQLQIESKEQLRKRGLKSTDTADALCLTFYGGQFQVAEQINYDIGRRLPGDALF